MAYMKSSLIDGDLIIKDNISLQDNTDKPIIDHDNNKNVYIGNDNAHLNINAKYVNINSEENLNINSQEDIKITSKDNLFLNGNKLCLGNSRYIYGIEDPNELEITNPHEGMIYFKIMMD